MVEWVSVVELEALDGDGARVRVLNSFLSLKTAKAYIESDHHRADFSHIYPTVHTERPEDGAILPIREGQSKELDDELRRCRFHLEHDQFYGVARWEEHRMPQIDERVCGWLDQWNGFVYGRSANRLSDSFEGEPVPPETRLYVVLKWDDVSELKRQVHPDERLRWDWVEPDSKYAPTRYGTIVAVTRTWLQAQSENERH